MIICIRTNDQRAYYKRNRITVSIIGMKSHFATRYACRITGVDLDLAQPAEGNLTRLKHADFSWPWLLCERDCEFGRHHFAI